MAFYDTVIFLNFLLCITVYTTVQGRCPQFKQCSNNSNVTNVLIPGGTCENGNAVLKKGTSASLEVDFESKVDSKKSTSVCHGILGGIPVPFPVADKNGCDTMSPACPIKKGQAYKFTTIIPVKSQYPAVRVVVKWEEKDDNEDDIFCVEIPAVIEA